MNYPLRTSAPWPREQWYVAGFSSEFAETPVERTVLGERILMFRSSKGEPVAFAGLCPHRFMPLVKGRRDGDSFECPYHGMTFDAAGKCLVGPAGGPPARPLRRYPLHETGPVVWIWTGDPARADPTLLPDLRLAGFAAEGWRSDPNGVMHIAGRWMLMVDNLFDLSHISWVHASVFGPLPICLEKPAISRDCGLLHFERRELCPADPSLKFLFPECVGPIESKLATTMLSPAIITAIGPAITEAESSPMAGTHWGTVQFVHCITPETERSTNVFTVVTRNFRLDDDALSEALCAQNKVVLAQDKDVAEAVEQALDQADTNTEMSFRSDRGGIEARRIISELIERELQL